MPGDIAPKGWVKIPPDLAVEVVSPNDSASELEEKLDDYRTAGVPLIWVIYPELRKVKILRQEGPAGESEGGRCALRRGCRTRLPLPPA